MNVGVIGELGARYVLGNMDGKVNDIDSEEGGAENSPLGDTIGHGN